MELLTLYVGQGALAAVKNCDEVVIVDSFMPVTDRDLMSEIEFLLDSFIGQSGRVTGLVLTGFDADHACPHGVDFILSSYLPDWIMYPKYRHRTDNVAAVFDLIERCERTSWNTEYPLRRLPVRLDRFDGRVFTDLAACFDFELFSPHPEDMDGSNNCSLVLKLTGLGQGGFSYLVTGDTETERWKTINRLFERNLSSNVMAAPHHGSESGLCAETISFVSPETVLISAGLRNRYGHPHPKALEAYLRRTRGNAFATNSNGGRSLLTRKTESGIETTEIISAGRESSAWPRRQGESSGFPYVRRM